MCFAVLPPCVHVQPLEDEVQLDGGLNIQRSYVLDIYFGFTRLISTRPHATWPDQ